MMHLESLVVAPEDPYNNALHAASLKLSQMGTDDGIRQPVSAMHFLAKRAHVDSYKVKRPNTMSSMVVFGFMIDSERIVYRDSGCQSQAHISVQAQQKPAIGEQHFSTGTNILDKKLLHLGILRLSQAFLSCLA